MPYRLVRNTNVVPRRVKLANRHIFEMESHSLFYNLPSPSSVSRKSIPPMSLYHFFKTPLTTASIEATTVNKYWIQWIRVLENQT